MCDTNYIIFLLEKFKKIAFMLSLCEVFQYNVVYLRKENKSFYCNSAFFFCAVGFLYVLFAL